MTDLNPSDDEDGSDDGPGALSQLASSARSSMSEARSKTSSRISRAGSGLASGGSLLWKGVAGGANLAGKGLSKGGKATAARRGVLPKIGPEREDALEHLFDAETPMPGLNYDPSDFHVEIDTEELVEETLTREFDPIEDLKENVKEDGIKKHIRDLESLMRRTKTNKGSLHQMVRRQRMDLKKVISNLQEYEEEMEGHHNQDIHWSKRLARVMYFTQKAHSEAYRMAREVGASSSPDLSDLNKREHRLIVKDLGNPRGDDWPDAISNTDTIDNGSLGPFDSNYGVGHMVYDLKRVRHELHFILSPADETNDKNIDHSYVNRGRLQDTLQQLNQELNENTSVFEGLVRARMLVDKLEEEEKIEEDALNAMSDNGDLNDLGKKVLNSLDEESGEIDDLATSVQSIMREEEWMISHFEDAKEILARIFEAEDRVAQQQEEVERSAVGKLRSVGMPDLKANVPEFFEKMAEASQGYNYGSSTYPEIYQEFASQWRETKKDVNTAREMEATEMSEVYGTYELINNLLGAYAEDSERAAKVEEKIIQNYSSEMHMYQEMEKEVNRCVNIMETELSRQIGDRSLYKVLEQEDDIGEYIQQQKENMEELNSKIRSASQIDEEDLAREKKVKKSLEEATDTLKAALISEKPPEEEHEFGDEPIENYSGGTGPLEVGKAVSGSKDKIKRIETELNTERNHLKDELEGFDNLQQYEQAEEAIATLHNCANRIGKAVDSLKDEYDEDPLQEEAMEQLELELELDGLSRIKTFVGQVQAQSIEDSLPEDIIQKDKAIDEERIGVIREIMQHAQEAGIADIEPSESQRESKDFMELVFEVIDLLKNVVDTSSDLEQQLEKMQKIDESLQKSES